MFKNTKTYNKRIIKIGIFILIIFINLSLITSTVWTRILGGTDNDQATAITIDSSSNLYIAGITKSSIFDGQSTNGGLDAYISKLNSSGVKQWTKIIGGSGDDFVYDITIDSSSNLYIVGSSSSNPFYGQAKNGHDDAFISKYDLNGNRQWIKLIGGAGWDEGNIITIDNSSSYFYIGGTTSSNPFDGLTNDNNNAFISKYDINGNKQWTKIFMDNRPQAITIDSSSNLYITGITSSNTFYGEANLGNWDSYASKFNSSGNIEWTKIFGGISGDYAYDITLDSNSNLYITGRTFSNSFEGLFISGTCDAFVIKFDSSGVKQWAKLFGGTATDEAYAITIDSNNYLHITGNTSSNPFDGQTTNGGGAFVSKFDSNGIKQTTILIQGLATPFGGITLDSSSNLYIAGYTASNPFDGQPTYGINDTFISKIAIICDVSCFNCSTSSNNCILCSSNYFKIVTQAFPTQCYNKAPTYGYMLNNSSYKLCTAYCSYNPVEVTDNFGYKYCDCQCPINQILENSICKSSCQNKINFNNNGICEPCTPGTKAHNQQCVSNCPNGFVEVTDINSNQYCDTTCPVEEVIEDNICKASCQNIFNFNNNGICEPCTPGTKTYNQLCVSNCPNGYLVVTNNISNQYCDAFCPLGEVNETNICKASCQNKINFNKNGTCLPCTPGTKAHNQQCVSNCPNGYVVVTDISTNQYCDDSCPLEEVNEDGNCKNICQIIFNFNNNGLCLPCSNGTKTHNQLCVSNCPNGFVEVTDINSNQYCDTSCPVGEVIEDNICKASCQNKINFNNYGICEPCTPGTKAHIQQGFRIFL
jgi:hypothetical protein